jgi:hypothetical protein
MPLLPLTAGNPLLQAPRSRSQWMCWEGAGATAASTVCLQRASTSVETSQRVECSGALNAC